MIKEYITKTSNFSLDDDPIIGIEVPSGFIDDLDLKINEVLMWSINTDTRTATITKKNIIINSKD